MKKSELENIKEIIKKYRNKKKYTNKEFGKIFGIGEKTMVGYIQRNKFVSKTFLENFIKLPELDIKEKEIILKYLKKETSIKENSVISDTIEEKLNKIMALLSGKEFIQNNFLSKNQDLKLIVKEKREELEKIEREIKLKKFEYEKLERTSGARSKITWACIDIQKFNSEKITEIINILGIIDEESKIKSYPALKQLAIHLETFSENVKKLVEETKIITIK